MAERREVRVSPWSRALFPMRPSRPDSMSLLWRWLLTATSLTPR